MQIRLPNGNIADVGIGTANEMVRAGHAEMVDDEYAEPVDDGAEDESGSDLEELEPEADPKPRTVRKKPRP